MYSCNAKVTFILAAAGIGERMRLGYPKQFLEYKNTPLFITPLKIAQKSSCVDKIIVVTGKDFIETVKKSCVENGITKLFKVVSGAEKRQHSIAEALKVCEKDTIIAVHDGVRPFIKESYLSDCLNILQKNNDVDGVVVGTPLKDTIKKISQHNMIIETPKREEHIAVQTPQLFRSNILIKAYEQAKLDNFLGTDDSSLVERIGGKIKMITGDYDNIKITTVEDLKYL